MLRTADEEEPLRRPVASERCLLAHDLNNNLSLILGRCHLQLEVLDPQSEAAMHARLIQEAAQHMARRMAEGHCPLCSRLVSIA